MGSIGTVERRYTRPFLHSLMHAENFAVTADTAGALILLVPSDDEDIGPRMAAHIRRAESAKVHEAAFIRGRTSVNKRWYDITGIPAGSVIWPKNRQYSHVAPHNADKLLCSDRIYSILARRHRRPVPRRHPQLDPDDPFALRNRPPRGK